MISPIAPDAVVQYWRGKSASAASAASMARAAAQFAAAGMTSVAWHGGPRDISAHWAQCAAAAASAGLACGAAWGLDGTQDTDGSKLTAREKGQAMGAVLAQGTCRFGLADAEGRWDANARADDMDESGALALGEEVRKLAPAKPLGDQLWFAIESHGDPRRIALPIGKGGPFAGFPADEFAFSCVDWIRFRQAYCNDFSGKNRYSRTFQWMDQDWAEFDRDLVTRGRGDLVRNEGVTVQGYGWLDILPDLTDCLLRYVVIKAQPVFVWSEPLPAPETMAAIKALHKLRDEGFTSPVLSPVDMVRAYQRAYNRTASQSKKLVEDGRAGAKTLASMGFM